MTYPQQIIPTEPDSGSSFIHTNSTVTASGSVVTTGVGSKEVTLVVNVTATPTGTTPTLVYTLQEVDPGNQLSVFGPTSSTPVINAIGVYTATLGATIGAAVKITWAVAGAGASFTGVYATVSSKVGTASTTGGTVLVSDASIGTTNSAVPVSASQFGGSDGTNLQSVRVFDGDAGAGSEYVLGAILRKSASGGTIEVGTSTDPLRVDPTGETTQPISAVSLPLPAGAATDATLATRLAEATFTGRINTLGQKTSAASTPVVLASDQTAVSISGTVTANIGTAGALALDATLIGGTQKAITRGGAKGSTVATDVTSSASGANHQPLDVAIYDASGNQITSFGVSVTQYADGVVRGTATGTLAMVDDGTNIQSVSGDTAGRLNTNARVTDGTTVAVVKPAGTAAIAADTALVVAVSPNNTIPVSAVALPLPTGAATEATLATRLADTTFTGRINTQGQKTSAGSTPVVLASDQSAISVTGTVTANVGTTNGLALDVTLTGGTQRTKITDGTSNAAVKAASTPAAAADPALVVAISPNNTLPISAVALPLPTGAATETTLTTRLADATFTGRINTLGQKTASASTPVVLASDQSAVPISGTVTANIGTINGLALDATLTGGAQKAITRGGAKGSTTAIDVTSSAAGANHQALDVAIYDNVGNQITAFVGSQYADGVGRGSAIGTLSMVDDGTNIQSVSGDTAGRLNTNARITDGTNTATVKAASTSAVAADPALVVAISPNSTSSTVTPDITATGALGVLNAAVQLATSGISSVGFQLAAGTLIGTILPEVSFDGGSTWVTTFLEDPSTALKGPSVVFTAANTATARVIISVGGAGHARIRVSAYTSGTANITLRGSARPGAVLARFTSAGAGYSILTSPNALPLGITGQITFYGTLKVSTEGSELFTEPFDGSVVDTTNRWAPTLVGSATLTQAASSLTVNTGTVASNAAAVSSQNLFRPVGLGFQIFGASVQLEATALTNNHRFWGLATVPGSWTASTPLQDAVGFEQDTTGSLNAVAYSGGVRGTSAPIARPVDGLPHRYAVYIRADLVYWYMDSLEVPIAGAGWPPLGQQILPIRIHSINHTTPPASAPLFSTSGVAMSETSHSGVQISDGTFAWRKATVDATGCLQVASSASNSNQTNVAGSTTTVVLLAANGSRKGATVFNDSASVLYLKLGATASTSSFSTRLVASAYYEVPFGYKGTIDGIWASATGAARITEFT